MARIMIQTPKGPEILETTKLTTESVDRLVWGGGAEHMDPTIRTRVNSAVAPCTAQRFLAAYCWAHEVIHGEPWLAPVPVTVRNEDSA